MLQVVGRRYSTTQHGRKWLAAQPPDPLVQQARCAAAPSSSIKGRERVYSLGSFFEEGLRFSPETGEKLRIVLTWRVLKAVRYWEGTNPSVFSLRSNPPSATSIVALSLSAHSSFRLIPPLRCIPHCGRSAPSPFDKGGYQKAPLLKGGSRVAGGGLGG